MHNISAYTIIFAAYKLIMLSINESGGFMQVFDYTCLRRKIYGFKERFPFAGYSVCARSWSGRAIFVLSLGNREAPALCLGGFRGGDFAGTDLMLRFFERLCTCIDTGEPVSGIKIKNIVQEKGVMIIPCVNPDGMEIVSHGAIGAGSYAGLVDRACADTASWRANARGVDLNLNFSCGFTCTKKAAESCGYTSPGPYFYAGKVPESEPETRALVRLCRARNIRHTLTVQSGADYIYSPCVGIGAERQDMMLKILELSSGISRLDDECGPLEKHGFSDWFSATYSRPSFVLNAQLSQKEIYQTLEEMLVLSIVM